MSGSERTMQHKPTRFLVIGVGPFAKRTYIRDLLALEKEGRAKLFAAVDVESNKEDLIGYQKRTCPNVEFHYVPFFTGTMPAATSKHLTELVSRLNISCVIISTEPLAHRAYGIWALNLGLNIIMDKPVTTRPSTVTSYDEAHGIAQDYDTLHALYQQLQRKKKTIFLVNSHRRYHPGFHFMLEMIEDVQKKTSCPVTNIVTTHCDGQWRLPQEILEQEYHTYNKGYGKISHSGYHFLDVVYQFMKAGMSEGKRPDRVEVVTSFVQPNGFLKQLKEADYKKLFGDKEYSEVCKYSDEELKLKFASFGEIDAAIQLTFFQDGEAVALGQLNLQHNGFGRRDWIQPGEDLYQGNGRVRHEMHEIKSGPFQTIVMDSRRAHAKHDKSVPVDGTLGSDNHFEVKVFRNCEMLGEEQPLETFSAADLDQRSKAAGQGQYSEIVKRGVLEEALDFIDGKKGINDLRSNLTDHSTTVHIMSAVYVSHIRRSQGLSPVVSIDLTYNAENHIKAQTKRAQPALPIPQPIEQYIEKKYRSSRGTWRQFGKLFETASSLIGLDF